MTFVGRFSCNVIERYMSLWLIPRWWFAFIVERNARFQLGVVQVEMIFFL